MPRNQRKVVIGLLLCSVVLKLGLAWVMRESYFERGNRYSIINPLAQNIIHRHEFSVTPGHPTAGHEPLYPLAVAGAYALFGTNWLSLAVIQALVAALNGLIIYYVALRIFANPTLSLASLALFSFYPFYVTQSISVTDTVFFCFGLALATLLTIRCVPAAKIGPSVLCGLGWGLTLLTRFSAVALFPMALLYFFLSSPWKKAVRTAVGVVIACCLVLAPWAYRNYRHSGKIFITSHGAIEVWLGYNPETENVLRNDISVDTMKLDLEKKIPEIGRLRSEDHASLISEEAEESRVFIREALSFAARNPGLCLKMVPLKLWKYWSWNYNPVSPSANAPAAKWWPAVYTLSYSPVLILALFGVFIKRPTVRSPAILLLFFLGYSLLHAALYGFSRLRIPLDQFLMIYAASAIVLVWDAILGKRRFEKGRRTAS